MSGNEGTEEGTPPPAGNSNLIVNYIPSSMNEDSLSEVFYYFIGYRKKKKDYASISTEFLKKQIALFNLWNN